MKRASLGSVGMLGKEDSSAMKEFVDEGPSHIYNKLFAKEDELIEV